MTEKAKLTLGTQTIELDTVIGSEGEQAIDIKPLRAARTLGLAAVNAVGPARRFFMKYAGGGAGEIDLDALRQQFVVSGVQRIGPVSYTHLRAHETVLDLVFRLLLVKKKQTKKKKNFNIYTLTYKYTRPMQTTTTHNRHQD